MYLLNSCFFGYLLTPLPTSPILSHLLTPPSPQLPIQGSTITAVTLHHKKHFFYSKMHEQSSSTRHWGSLVDSRRETDIALRPHFISLDGDNFLAHTVSHRQKKYKYKLFLKLNCFVKVITFCLFVSYPTFQLVLGPGYFTSGFG